ncbi:MAG: hypothetical protein RIQ60_1630 [Pseudomonadota bacterium]|jgi:hypothetical protein
MQPLPALHLTLTTTVAAVCALALNLFTATPGAAAESTGPAAKAPATAPAPATADTSTANSTAAVDVPALLRAADRWRTGPDASLAVETEVQLLARDGTPEKERRYSVYLQPGHKTLVLMRSPAEAGQKLLMLGDDFWLLLPGSQRPLRITPTQKLLGEASTGDIATLSWAEDYSGQLVGLESCAGNTPCRHLSLQAARKGLSYQRIELWLGAERHEPLRAEFHVQSDKLAKQASFVFEHGLVSAMLLSDHLGSQKQTRVRYLSRQPRQLPESWLNPMFLARNPALE